MLLAFDVSLAGLTLCIERIEFLLGPSSVDLRV
jgi:hypothetical protein